jgi:hypothetical protein
VPDHHLGQVHALLAEDPHRDPAGLVRARGVHGDGRAGLDVGPGDGAGDALDAGAGLGGLQGELEEGGLDPRVPMPSVMSREKSVTIGSGMSMSRPGPR